MREPHFVVSVESWPWELSIQGEPPRRRRSLVIGKAEGRVLLALDDGRVLQNRATLHETLSAHLNGPMSGSLRKPGPVSLEIETETVIEENGLGP